MFAHLCKIVNEITNLVWSHGTLRKEKPVQRHLKNHLKSKLIHMPCICFRGMHFKFIFIGHWSQLIHLLLCFLVFSAKKYWSQYIKYHSSSRYFYCAFLLPRSVLIAVYSVELILMLSTYWCWGDFTFFIINFSHPNKTSWVRRTCNILNVLKLFKWWACIFIEVYRFHSPRFWMANIKLLRNLLCYVTRHPYVRINNCWSHNWTICIEC